MAAIKKKILLVDADPQGNASTGFGILDENRTPSLYDLNCLRRGLDLNASIKKQ